ncbi:trypsin domain-containing protein [Ditylenchus destructor]|uniref:Trypsin domain-containing protein n=1 Tax=Ditylenchus destructor TaxID=166010 RepID=A0AAD4QTZ7_9BILA|nr:trypsin domain-containing protein [Ditylenchus destructor]
MAKRKHNTTESRVLLGAPRNSTNRSVSKYGKIFLVVLAILTFVLICAGIQYFGKFSTNGLKQKSGSEEIAANILFNKSRRTRRHSGRWGNWQITEKCNATCEMCGLTKLRRQCIGEPQDRYCFCPGNANFYVACGTKKCGNGRDSPDEKKPREDGDEKKPDISCSTTMPKFIAADGGESAKKTVCTITEEETQQNEEEEISCENQDNPSALKKLSIDELEEISQICSESSIVSAKTRFKRIIGGDRVRHTTQYRFAANIIRVSDGKQTTMCGASIVSRCHAFVVRHCFSDMVAYDFKEGRITMLVGGHCQRVDREDDCPKQTMVERRMKMIAYDPEDSSDFAHEFAILQFERRLPKSMLNPKSENYISLACLPSLSDRLPKKVFSVGWGHKGSRNTQREPDDASHLRVLPLVTSTFENSDTMFNDKYILMCKETPLDPENIIFCGYGEVEENRQSTGPGDSGSGNVVVSQSGKNTIYGITIGSKRIDSTQGYIREVHMLSVQYFLHDICGILKLCVPGALASSSKRNLVAYSLPTDLKDAVSVQERIRDRGVRILEPEENEKIQERCRSINPPPVGKFSAALALKGIDRKYFATCTAVAITPYHIVTVQSCLNKDPDLLMGGICLNPEEGCENNDVATLREYEHVIYGETVTTDTLQDSFHDWLAIIELNTNSITEEEIETGQLDYLCMPDDNPMPEIPTEVFVNSWSVDDETLRTGKYPNKMKTIALEVKRHSEDNPCRGLSQDPRPSYFNSTFESPIVFCGYSKASGEEKIKGIYQTGYGAPAYHGKHLFGIAVDHEFTNVNGKVGIKTFFLDIRHYIHDFCKQLRRIGTTNVRRGLGLCGKTFNYESPFTTTQARFVFQRYRRGKARVN